MNNANIIVELDALQDTALGVIAAHNAGFERRVLLMLPTRRDNALARQVLAREGLDSLVCSDLAEFTAALASDDIRINPAGRGIVGF